MKSKPRDGGRNAQLVRTLQILRELSRSTGLTLVQLARSFGTTERTIRRDLAALQEAGFPLSSDDQSDRRKVWRLNVSANVRGLSSMLDKGHYLALRIAMGQGGPVRSDDTVFSALEDLHGKIEKAVGERGRKHLLAIDQCFHSYEKQAYREAPPELLWQLVTAIIERRLCRVTYRKPQRTPSNKTFDILPLRIFAYQGAAYLMCHIRKHAAYATLNLQRVKKLEVLPQCAEVPSDFDPTHFENAAFGVHTGDQATQYVLRFDADVAAYIHERTWHPSQSLTELEDGGVELTFTCGASWEVSAWVASWRHWVHVVEPEELRDELRALGSTLTKRYSARR
jgi:predicted DNA-binding transcriptional regulator YafY